MVEVGMEQVSEVLDLLLFQVQNRCFSILKPDALAQAAATKDLNARTVRSSRCILPAQESAAGFLIKIIHEVHLFLLDGKQPLPDKSSGSTIQKRNLGEAVDLRGAGGLQRYREVRSFLGVHQK